MRHERFAFKGNSILLQGLDYSHFLYDSCASTQDPIYRRAIVRFLYILKVLKMTDYDVVGIGNALVDVIVNIEDSFLEDTGMPKGSMNLVDLDQSDMIYAKLSSGREVSGGSAGNTMAGIAALGGKGAYIGKVRDDQFGKVFRHDIRSIGVDFETPDSTDGINTGKCLVMVHPDAERTMATFLGAANSLTPADVNPATIQAAKVVYMEGYLFDPEDAKAAFVKAAEAAHAGPTGTKVSLSLSDPFCVGRHREAFVHLVEHHIDILFANEEEIMSLYETDDFDAAVADVRGHCEIACLTRGAKGSVIVTADDVISVPAVPVEKVIDTTGAGDQYAAGFLYGYTQGWDLETAGCAGSIMAGEIISHYGARPEADVKALIQETLG